MKDLKEETNTEKKKHRNLCGRRNIKLNINK
jgi:hypothetical protein